MLHLDIRNPFVYINSVRIKHGAVSKISFYQNYPEFTEHTELIIAPKENDRRQNTNSMPGRERDRWEKNRLLPIMVRKIQTIYEKKIQDRYWTTKKKQGPDPKGTQKKTCNQIFFGH